MTQDLRAEVNRLIGMILERPVSASENPSRASEPNWDSLKHAELVFLVEDHFGVRFSEQDLARINDSEQLTRLVEERLAP